MNLILLTSGYTFTRNAVGRLRQSGQEVATDNDRWYQSPTCCSIPGDGTFWIVRNHRHCTRVFGFESWTCHPAPGHGSRLRSVHYRRHRTRLRASSGCSGGRHVQKTSTRCRSSQFIRTHGPHESSACQSALCFLQKKGRPAWCWSSVCNCPFCTLTAGTEPVKNSWKHLIIHDFKCNCLCLIKIKLNWSVYPIFRSFYFNKPFWKIYCLELDLPVPIPSVAVTLSTLSLKKSFRMWKQFTKVGHHSLKKKIDSTLIGISYCCSILSKDILKQLNVNEIAWQLAQRMYSSDYGQPIWLWGKVE